MTAERLAAAWVRAGLPENVLQVLHLSPELTEQAIKDSRVNFVAFTGSVQGGKAVDTAAVRADGFKGVALEVRQRRHFHVSSLIALLSSLVERTQHMYEKMPT